MIFCWMFLGRADFAHAGAMLYRIQQMKAMKQHQAEAEYQRYMESKQGGQGQKQAQSQQPTYDQSVEARNQSIAQAILEEHPPSDSPSENVPSPNSPAQPPAGRTAAEGPQSAPAVPSGDDVRDVKDLTEVWKKLDAKSTVWQLLIDDQAKVLTVSEYLGRFQRQGVKIANAPQHYVQMIDAMSTDNPKMLDMPFGDLIKVLAIIEYDFDNGMDKDALAKKVLGQAGFEANKKRFTQQPSQQQ